MARKDPDGFAQADLLYGLAAQIAPKEDPSGARELVRQRYESIASHLGPDNALPPLCRRPAVDTCPGAQRHLITNLIFCP